MSKDRQNVMCKAVLFIVLGSHCAPPVELGQNPSRPDSGSAMMDVDFTLGDPALSLVTPRVGSSKGGTTITLLGQNFAFGAQVSVAGIRASQTVVWSSTRITTILPASLGAIGSVRVTVENPGGRQVSHDNLFGYYAEHPDFAGLVLGDYTYDILAVIGIDLNNDKRLDLAYFSTDKRLHILLNQGSRSFATSDSFSLRGFEDYSNTTAIAMGDFNNDKRLDLITDGNMIKLTLGNGVGGFFFSSTITDLETRMQAPTIADFNRDNLPDVAVAYPNSNRVGILLGEGNGRFAPAVFFAAGTSPAAMATGDWNGDQNADLAVISGGSNQVSVLLGDGSGAFTAVASPTVGANPAAVAVADLNGDTRPDLVVANSGSDSVSILLGDGRGGFSGLASVPVGAGPAAVATGDFNGDKRPDLAVANANGDTVSILLGDGAGNFVATTPIAVAQGPRYLFVGDFDGDQNPDLAVNTGADGMSVFWGDGTGRFVSPLPVAPGTTPWALKVADINGDQHPDLATLSATGVNIVLGDGTGEFAAPSAPLEVKKAASFDLADFNGDQRPDLAIVDTDSSNVSILLNVGAGRFAPAGVFPAGVTHLVEVLAADLNGDQRADLIVRGQVDFIYAVSVRLGDGHGGFGPAIITPLTTYAYSLGVGDFNADQKADIVITEHDNGLITFLGDGLGHFTRAGYFLPAGEISSFAIGDFNGDRKQDFVFLESLSSPLSILWGDGKGGFGAASEISPSQASGQIVVGDINNDQELDIVTTNRNAVRIILGNGMGGFGRPTSFAAREAPYLLVISDLDHDKRPDLIVANGAGGGISVLRNLSR